MIFVLGFPTASACANDLYFTEITLRLSESTDTAETQ